MTRNKTGPSPVQRGFRQHRRELRFVAIFALLLAAGFALISFNWVNDHVVEPFTAFVARASATLLQLLGQELKVDGTVMRSDRFAVDIRNGCNGVETVLIFASAVLAFPAPWPGKLIGVVLGTVAIQLVNLLRVAALFMTGAYLPRLFNTSHTVVWQTVIILVGVVLWLLWAVRFAAPGRAAESA